MTMATRAFPAVVATRVPSRRVQTDEHKHAVSRGKRNARHAKDAAKGLTRELAGDSFVPAIGTRATHQQPRLVKQPPKK